MKKESRTSKIVTSLIGFTCVGILMFMLGRVSNNTRTSEVADESQSYNYTIESSYIPAEINFEEEASYIKTNFNSSIINMGAGLYHYVLEKDESNYYLYENSRVEAWNLIAEFWEL